MTTTVRTTAATKRVPMDSLRKTALVAGALYLIPLPPRYRPGSCSARCGTIRTTSSARGRTRRCSSPASSM